jgi:conjugative relaxase-like TrwC/TraI family protein
LQVKHRVGYDLCFHAPKSVSILALDGGDKRFYTVHLEAVKETLKVIEQECTQAKVFLGREVCFENTENLTIALVRYTASRAIDPHLHHHALVMKREDRSWRALASSMTKDKVVNGFMEHIYRNQIYYGLIYRSILANRVQELGCEIEVVGKHGMWEIKGVPQAARGTMSKRRKEIKGLLNQLDYHSFKAADIASLDSREKKPKHMNWEKMRRI